MLKVGLTGNIGSGKTTISKVFKMLDVAVYHADDEAKKFIDENSTRKRLLATFGKSILGADGKIDRKLLSDIVFSDNKALNRINAIIHPKVADHFKDWTSKHQNDPYILQEAAIIFESGFDQLFDYVILITAPLELRIKRVSKRDAVTRNDIILRDQKQWNDDRKSKLADYIIYNDEMQLVIPQVISIHEELIKKAK